MFEYALKQSEPGLLMVKLVGDLKACQEVHSLRDAIGQSQRQGQTHLILDFDQINFIDSFGLGFLALLKGMFRDNGGAVAILNPNDVVRRALEFTCMDQLIPPFTSMGEAKKYLHEAKTEPRVPSTAEEKMTDQPKEVAEAKAEKKPEPRADAEAKQEAKETAAT